MTQEKTAAFPQVLFVRRLSVDHTYYYSDESPDTVEFGTDEYETVVGLYRLEKMVVLKRQPVVVEDVKDAGESNGS